MEHQDQLELLEQMGLPAVSDLPDHLVTWGPPEFLGLRAPWEEQAVSAILVQLG